MKVNNRVRVPKQDRSIAKKNRLLDAGMELFISKGYEQTNSREIAEQAGVSVGTFYSYFADKKALFIEIIKRNKDQSIAGMLQRAERLGKQENLPKTTYSLIEGIMKKRELPQAFMRQAYALRCLDTEVERFYHDEEKVTLNIIKDVLVRFEDLLRKDIDTASRMVLITLKEVMNAYAIFQHDIKKSTLLEELSDMIDRYLFQ
jgi:AcrR family transcriptional regulator